MKLSGFLLLSAVILFAASCGNPETTREEPTPAPQPDTPAMALPKMPEPENNPITPEKAALGAQLFFDTRLSKNGDMSCENCHFPSMAWTDGKTFSTKFDGKPNTRNTPTILNAGYYHEWYWDGRAATLEGQITAAWKGQMGGDPDAVAMKLNGIDGYKQAFEKAMGGPATAENIPQAIATFVRTVVSDDSPWDRYELKNDKTAVSEDAIQGQRVFSETAQCALCHTPPLYTDLGFHNIGVGMDKPTPDLGRGKFLETSAQKDKKPVPADAREMMGAFKTPTLRSVTETAPYFHDGSAATLEEAVDFVLAGGHANPTLDPKLTPKTLKPEEKAQLIAFLKSLTPASKPFEKPALP
ncbi:MAG TPA: cytochrome c peroxidase [Terriglobia bacterium]|nr:cytochrome c peroxidase [Terriglobia bacterium]